MDNKFQVNLKGMISLLSDHLYSDSDVYIRELLQNAADSITARQQFEPEHVGAVKLEVTKSSEDGTMTLVVCDNGIGLSEPEVHQFLATIGQSSKRENIASDDFLGQFGVGLLSSFMVCEEVVIVTQSIQPNSKAVEWKGRSDGTYSVKSLDHNYEPGTQVYLRAKPGCNDFFDVEYIRNTARHYGCHLPVAIEIGYGETRELINDEPPWSYEYPNKEIEKSQLLEYGKRVFDIDFLDAIPIQSSSGGAEGIAFILPFSAQYSSKQSHRVYLKNMLLSEKIDNLLPDWAFFVQCVVNTSNLRPTASRESFYENEDLENTKTELGSCLRQFLIRLAKEDRSRLNQIIDLHYLPMKALAVDDDEFFRFFIDWLPFETSLGWMTLAEYCQTSRVVKYVESRDQFRQISSVASAQSVCVVNCGYTYDVELMERLPIIMPERETEAIKVSDFLENFDDLTHEEHQQVFEFIKYADLVLQTHKCAVEIKKFRPTELPMLYTTSSSANFFRSVEQSQEVSNDLWSGMLGNLTNTLGAEIYSQVCLNYNNLLIRELSELKDKKLIKQIVEMLYVQGLLLGHYPLKAQEMKLLNDGLLGLIRTCLGKQEKDPQ